MRLTAEDKRNYKLVPERSGGVCEYCHMAEATQIHHRKYRSRGGKHRAQNLIHLCLRCHNLAHSAAPPYGLALHGWEDEGTPYRDIGGVLFHFTADGLRLDDDEFKTWVTAHPTPF